MLRAPRLNYNQLEVLNALVRLNFLKEIRDCFVDDGERKEATISKVLNLVDAFSDTSHPILVTMTLMDIHASDECVFPLEEDKFNVYNTILNVELTHNDFPGIPVDIYEAQAVPMREIQKELKRAFDTAAFLDRDKLNDDQINQEVTVKEFLN